MDFVNEGKFEITYKRLKILQSMGNMIDYNDLIYLFGKKIWYFTEKETRQCFKTLDDKMKEHVKGMLYKHNYNITKTADALNISKSKMYRLIRKYKIRHFSWKKFN